MAARKASAPKNKQPFQPDGISATVDNEDEDMGENVAGPSTPRIALEASLTAIAAEDEEEDETVAKERRKREKREKRANRNKKIPAIDTEQVRRPSATPSIASELDGNGRSSLDPLARSPTPPMLEAFPLPTSAPTPAASVLSRQGLPAGLEDATFVDQDSRIPLDSLKDEDGKEYLNHEMKKRLAGMGVKEFFAGTSIRPRPI